MDKHHFPCLFNFMHTLYPQVNCCARHFKNVTVKALQIDNQYLKSIHKKRWQESNGLKVTIKQWIHL